LDWYQLLPVRTRAKDIAMIEDVNPQPMTAASDAPRSPGDDGERRQRPILRLSTNYSQPSPTRAPLFRR